MLNPSDFSNDTAQASINPETINSNQAMHVPYATVRFRPASFSVRGMFETAESLRAEELGRLVPVSVLSLSGVRNDFAQARGAGAAPS